MDRPAEIQNVDIKAFLRTAYDLQDTELLERLSAVAQLRGFAAHQMIANVGSPTRELMVIVAGTVRVFFVDYEGVSFTDCFLSQAGYPINTPRLNQQLECGLEAATAVTLLCIPADWLLSELEHNVALLKLQLKLMDWAVYFHWREKTNRCRLSALQRYLLFRREYPDLDGQISSKYIAEYIGVAPESLSRLRRELRNARPGYKSVPEEVLLRKKPWES